MWGASLMLSLWYALAGLASLACYFPARRAEGWASASLSEEEVGAVAKFRRKGLRERLDRWAKASTQALLLALICFVMALLPSLPALPSEGTLTTDELLWEHLDALWLGAFALLACFSPPITAEGGPLKGRPHENRLIQTHFIPASVFVFVVFRYDHEGLPPLYRLIYVAPGLRLLWHYLSHKTIPRRALAITLLVGTTLVYSAVVWRTWQSSPFA